MTIGRRGGTLRRRGQSGAMGRRRKGVGEFTVTYRHSKKCGIHGPQWASRPKTCLRRQTLYKSLFLSLRPQLVEVNFTQSLSAVLSGPATKKSEVNTFFTRHWGDTFVQPLHVPPDTNLAKADEKYVQNYVKSTAKEYRKYKASKKITTRLHNAGITETKSDANDLPTVFVDSSFLLSHGPTFKAIFTVPVEGESDPLRLKDDKNPFFGDNAPPIAGENMPGGSIRDYEELHQHLESLHDIVDNRLAAKLVHKSDHFWRIVHSYSGLGEDLTAAMGEVKSVRSNLAKVSELIVHRTNNIVKMYEMRERKRKLMEKLKTMKCLKEAQSTVQMLLNQNDYPKVIDCIDTSQEVLEAELAGVSSFKHLGMQLSELYGVVGKMMHEEFAQLIQREFVKTENPETIHYEGELSSILLGVMKMKKFTFMHVIRTEISEGIKGILRQVVKNRIIESGTDLTKFDPSLNNLGEPLRAMSTKNWLKTLTAVSTSFLNFCVKLQTFQNLLADWADHIASSYCSEAAAMGREAASICQPTKIILSSDSEQSDNEIEASTSSFSQQLAPSSDPSALIAVEVRSQFHLIRVVAVIAEYGHFVAQQRLCRLLVARSKEPSTDSASSDEIVECRTILKQYLDKGAENGWNKNMPVSASPLFTCMQKVSVDFLNRFHQARRSKMGEALDVELWKAAQISPTMQATAIDCMMTGKLRKVADLKTGKDTSCLKISDEEYVVVGSSLVFLQILAEYCACLEVLPSFTADLLSRIIELLKAFNSRCCQLILGAGALQLVGLKTISVKNLALASRSLQMIVRFVPFISAEVEEYLKEDQKHLMRHFKQVLSDYSDHINEISAKLIAVIDHHNVTCLAAWEPKGTAPSSAFQQICRQLQKFQNGLIGIFPSPQIKAIYETVHTNFKVHLKQQLAKIGITPHDSVKYGMVCQDYAFYVQTLQNMDGCQELVLETLNEIMYGQ